MISGPAACIILSPVIGQSPRRKEDERLITGRGRFIDDIVPPGLLHLVLVRSTHARARLVTVDATAARKLPGVTVFLADDLPGLADPLPASRADRTNPYVRLDTPRPQLAARPWRGPLRRRADRRGDRSRSVPGRRRGRAGPGRVRAASGRGRRRSGDGRRGAGGARRRRQRRRAGRQGHRRRRSRVRRGRRDRRRPSPARPRDLDGDRDARALRRVRPGHRHHDGVGRAPGRPITCAAPSRRGSGCPPRAFASSRPTPAAASVRRKASIRRTCWCRCSPTISAGP